MAYTVAYCDRFMDELLDKMGSDYFPTPIKLSRFQSIALQYIRESTAVLEATQEISDDIVPWIISAQKSLSSGKNFKYLGKNFYQIKFPEDYIRLLNVIPYASTDGNNIANAEIKIYKIGNFLHNEKNPFRKAQENIINIYRIDNSAIIDTKITLDYADFTYVRKPIFGENSDDKMVDHPNDLVVDKLMHKTCVSLRATTSDTDTRFLDEYTERQGQKTM